VNDKADAELEKRGIDVIRALGMDGPRAANSGHQGTAMSLAPLAHVLFTRALTYDAADPSWPDRDRLILSNGHASILLYSMLHLTGQGLELDDLKAFRQWGSATPGHPEVGHTAGVEVTTGPLGQGLGNGVGMAIAERNHRARFGSELSDHYTYVIAGDGCLSEGISHEAASLAGHLGLGRLIVFYDDNHITIDGVTELALHDDAAARFAAYGWDVNDLGEEAENLDAIEGAIDRAKSVEDKPSLIILRTHIGFPSPDHTDTHEAHGLAFDDASITATKAVMGIPDEPFWVPDAVLAYYREAGARGGAAHDDWNSRFAAHVGTDSTNDRAAWDAAWAGTGLAGWEDFLPNFIAGEKMATRKASQAVLTALASQAPGLIGGSADLTGNTGTMLPDLGVQGADDPGGRQVYFGVREHAMGAAMVGLAHHGGTLPFGGTFLVFSDYMRPSVRLAGLSNAKCIFVWTHDSVGVGEDGPTHQPIEHVMSLRNIPGVRVIRPADATETAGAWKLALDASGPTALILSRQDLPILAHSSVEGVSQGAYVLSDAEDADAVLIGTGSEVALCMEAAAALGADGIAVRVVSMPCWEAFANLSFDEQDAVLPPDVPTVSVEAGITQGWGEHADLAVGIDRFGASAPGSTVLSELGMNVGNVTDAVKELLAAVGG
jgi:transketolase